LHLGHARSFLLAWWSVRSRGGRILMRIEDLDAGRVRRENSDAILADLAWLGLDWDGPAHVQSRATDNMWRHAKDLVDRGMAYACVCSRKDVTTAQSAPQLGDSEARYPGTCRNRFGSLEQATADTGQAAGLRFRVPPGGVEITDALAGTEWFDVEASVGDFLIARRDRTPAYQLAVVVSDAEQGVTEVLRGDDLWPSAARQWHLQNALGLPHPRWVHVPLVVDSSGRRLAKRDGDLALGDLRAAGVDPRAIVAWAAQSAGMQVPERITPFEAVRGFSLEAIPRRPVVVDAATAIALRAAR
jgi:glutamyl-tRNA synthetase